MGGYSEKSDISFIIGASIANKTPNDTILGDVQPKYPHYQKYREYVDAKNRGNRKQKTPHSPALTIEPFSAEYVQVAINIIDKLPENERPVAILVAFSKYIAQYKDAFKKATLLSESKSRIYDDALRLHAGNTDFINKASSTAAESTQKWRKLGCHGLDAVDVFPERISDSIGGVSSIRICDKISDEFKHTNWEDRNFSKILDIIDKELLPLVNSSASQSSNKTPASEDKQEALCQPTATQSPAPEPPPMEQSDANDTVQDILSDEPPMEQSDANDTVQDILSDEMPQQVEDSTLKKDKPPSLPMPTELY